jgi:hypothetical protein
MQELAVSLPCHNHDFIQSTNRPFHPNTQIRYVIPPFSKDIFPEKYRQENKVEMKELKFKWMFCRYFWESHVELKEISLEVLNEWDKEYR